MTSRAADHPIVGVLGGMGPEATVDFMRRIIAATPARDDADHIHMIVDCNPKVPSRIAALIEGTGESPSPELCRMARNLQAQGANVLAMPCNTAHHYAADIQAAVAIPLLDMPLLTAEKLAGLVMSQRRVGLLASTAVVKLRHYEKLLTANGLTTVIPDDQAALMTVIRSVKTGDTSRFQRQKLLRITESLMAERCDVLLIACTELSLFSSELGDNLPVVDSLDVLVREVVTFVQQHSTNKKSKFALGQS